jgi:transketolase
MADTGNGASLGATNKELANAIRALAMDGVQKANSGHPGMPMGMADVATVLYTQFLKFDAEHPEWPDRDRFVLSAGHGSMLLYSLLYLTGYPEMTIEQLRNFRQLGSITAGHPEYGHAPGIETTSGPLGQGLATAVGMALGERMQNTHCGDECVNHYTYVIAGDGCLMEGVSHEAIDLAGHLKLGRLILLWDDNSITIDGSTSMSTSTDQIKRFEASGWHTQTIDGHNPEQIAAAIAAARAVSDKPSIIACKTVIGCGAPNKQGTHSVHGEALGDAEIAATRQNIGWPYAPFEIPAHILNAWRSVGQRSRAECVRWHEAASKLDGEVRAQIVEPVTDAVRAALAKAIRDVKAAFSDKGEKLATRQSSAKVLDAIYPTIPGLIGGSADLTGSVGTKTSHYKAIKPGEYGGNYMHYGIREFEMGAAMNGLALHGGFAPYAGTFLVFSDYARGAIRLSALMGVRVVYVMTHDSIGLGEDGPTHQPVEHLASLRAIPNLLVFRPADSVEVAECWEVALGSKSRPSIMTLTRQGLPVLRTVHTDENLSSKGAYVLSEPAGGRDVTLLATGSEVSIAKAAADALAGEGVKAAVVSMPSWELFAEQPEAYRKSVLGTAPRVAVEAAVQMGWDRWIGENGVFIGMKGFGASAPAPKLYEHFGITAEKVAEAAKGLIGR